jgi:hypothetical protein
MLGGELSFHLLNVLLLTLLIAPLVLWRYRRAVLTGMQGRGGELLPVAAPGRAPRRAEAPDAARAALRWERRMRRRVFFAVLCATFVSALPLSALFFYLEDLQATPAHLYLKAGVLSSAAVPIFAVLTALPFWRALLLWLATLVGLAAVGVVLSMLQRPPTCSQPTRAPEPTTPYTQHRCVPPCRACLSGTSSCSASRWRSRSWRQGKSRWIHR